MMSQICSSYFDSRRAYFIRSVGGLIDDGTIVLAEILQHKYRLDFSDVSNIGVVSLAKALCHNSTICVLKLNGKIIMEQSLSFRPFITTLNSVNCN